jgi:hypothetical protein
MPVETVFGQSWSRHHDKKGQPYVNPAPRTAYPNSLEQLVELCKDPAAGRLHAAGSHWALSDAALSDITFVETHDAREDWEQHPPGVIKPAMGETIPDVIPKCLNRTYLDWLNAREVPHYLVHVESGKRVYQLYAELDQEVNTSNVDTLGGYMKDKYENDNFKGPWAPATLGGAGGQTIVGALTTGTHGGDFDRPPIADAVCAIHLVADGGRQFWIEPTPGDVPALTDDDALHAVYGPAPGFEIIRKDDVFNAALVSVGRFGIIYSVVLRAVRQYDLYEQRRYAIWQEIKDDIKNFEGWLYNGQPLPVDADGEPLPEELKPSSQPGNPRFLQIVVCLTPIAACTQNRVAITKRWELPLPDHPLGRDQRVGTLVPGGDDPLIKAPRFTNAGRNHGHSVDPDNPQRSADPGLFEIACMNGNFLVGVIEKVIEELEEFATSGGAIIGGGLATILIPGAGGVLLLIPALWLILQLLKEFIEHFDPDNTVGSTLDSVRDLLLDPPGGDVVPGAKAAGLLAWQLIGAFVFGELQGPLEFEGISYAMMDRKDYKQRSCETNGDSVEVFFDATSDELIAFVDALVSFERNQEFNGRAFVGYVSLRFMQPSRALLGEQKWPITCSVEVAGLKDVKGSQEVVTYAHDLALNPTINGFLHWGQKNTYDEAHVQFRYGNELTQWRNALGHVTGHGDQFSSAFTRQAGLEP